jgi:hypothetical protein
MLMVQWFNGSMDSIASSPPLPLLTSDPALLDDCDWDRNPAPPSSTYSDDLEAILLTRQEVIQRKNKERQVIQHRGAWSLAETFRSEADYVQGRMHHSCLENSD